MSFFESKKKTSQSVDMGPWKEQQPFLKDAWGDAQSLYDKQSAQPGYEGDFFATMSPSQQALIKSMIGYSTGEATNRADTLYGQANNMTTTGMNGVTNTANAITDFANTDRTGAIISDAGRIADNPYMSDMVKATMTDAYRGASENTIPNLYRDAASGSNLNSSRTALMQGVVERGLAEKTADVSSLLRGNAYNKGLDIGFGNQKLNLESLLGAGGLYDSLNKTGLVANELATRQRDTATDRGMAGEEMLRQNAQMGLDNDYAKFRYAEDRPWDLLNRYYGIVGSQNWGKTGTQETTERSTPSGAQILSGIIGTVGSFFGSGGMFGSGGAFGGMFGGKP